MGCKNVDVPNVKEILSIRITIQPRLVSSCPLSKRAAAVQNEAVSGVGIYSRITSQKTEAVIGRW